MTETVTNYRRIDRLKALAHEQGFTNEDAKQFGKLSKTATWEVLLKTYGIPLHPVDTFDRSVDNKAQSLDTSDWTNDASFPVCNFTPQNSTNFLGWRIEQQFLHFCFLGTTLYRFHRFVSVSDTE
jgi:hypothetical protein